MQIAPALSLVYQTSINQGVLPSDWKEAYMYLGYHSITAMLDKLQWSKLTLRDRRHHLMVTMMHKIVNNLININASSYLTPITSATRGHPIRYLHIAMHLKNLDFLLFCNKLRD